MVNKQPHATAQALSSPDVNVRSPISQKILLAAAPRVDVVLKRGRESGRDVTLLDLLHA
jgi:hypothetical protein